MNFFANSIISILHHPTELLPNIRYCSGRGECIRVLHLWTGENGRVVMVSFADKRKAGKNSFMGKVNCFYLDFSGLRS